MIEFLKQTAAKCRHIFANSKRLVVVSSISAVAVLAVIVTVAVYNYNTAAAKTAALAASSKAAMLKAESEAAASEAAAKAASEAAASSEAASEAAASSEAAVKASTASSKAASSKAASSTPRQSSNAQPTSQASSQSNTPVKDDPPYIGGQYAKLVGQTATATLLNGTNYVVDSVVFTDISEGVAPNYTIDSRHVYFTSLAPCQAKFKVIVKSTVSGNTAELSSTLMFMPQQ